VRCISVLLVAIDNTIVNVALPSRGSSWWPDTSATGWAVSGYCSSEAMTRFWNPSRSGNYPDQPQAARLMAMGAAWRLVVRVPVLQVANEGHQRRLDHHSAM
jgi:hypothetical protein